MKLPDKRWIFAAAVALLCAAGVLLHGLPAAPAALLMGPAPTPVPAPTAAPTPAPVQGAATILADGAPVVTLETRAQAEELLRAWLERGASAVPQGQTLVSAAFDKTMDLREAASGEQPLSFEQALSAFSADPALCPVRCVTYAVEVQKLAFTTEETQDARIPRGTRLVLQLGREGERVTTTQTIYINGVVQEPPLVMEKETLAPLAQRAAAGSYTSSHPDREPGRGEGPKGPAAPQGFALSLPVKGDILSNFGMRNGKMHYGLDLKAKIGDNVAAPAAGAVLFAGERGSYGFVLEIDHGGGFVTRVAPLSGCTLRAGDAVETNARIGALAVPEDEEETPHLYMELLVNGIPYNPRQYLK